MDYEILMYTATGFYFVCYVPELYANYKNKNANLYNIPEKVLLLLGSILAFSYALQLGNVSIIVNYGLSLGIDVVALSMRLYYAFQNFKQIRDNNDVPTMNEA
jgi:lipid-A-disaccharide synthase-like uncharacterized protein